MSDGAADAESPAGQITRLNDWADVFAASSLVECTDSPGVVPDVLGAPGGRRSLAVFSLLDGRVDLPDQVPPEEDDSVVLVFIEEGRCAVDYGSQTFRLEAGDSLFWETTDSVEFEALTTVRRRMLLLPRTSVARICPEYTTLVGVRITDQSELVGTLFEVLDLLEARLPGMQAGIRQAAARLLLQLVGELSPVLTSPEHLRLLAKILRYIEDNLGSATLTPAGIAAAHAISLRGLYALFGQYHAAVSGHIRDRRLSHGYADVVQNVNEPLSRIAGRWGFSSAAHFSRLFRERYGLSPSQLRSGADNK